MRQRIISLLSVLTVMAGIIIVSESAQTVAEGPETVDTSESVGSGGNRERGGKFSNT